MMFRRISSGYGDALNLTPMIDVIFQLVLFFMITAEVGTDNYSIDIEPPSLSEKVVESSSQESLVQITKDNKFLFKSRPVEFEVLKRSIDEYYEQNMTPITVLADRDSSLWPTINLLNYCQLKRFKVQYLINKKD